MAPRKKLVSPKRTQDELKDLRALQITIEGSEATLQRLAALLLFADHLEPKLEYKDTPLPWEDPNDPKFLKPPELEIDRNRVMNALMPMLESYLNQHGEEKAKAMIASYGAPRLGELTDTQLLDLHNSLAGEAAGE